MRKFLNILCIAAVLACLAPAARAATLPPSPNNTTLTSADGAIIDAHGHEWKLAQSKEVGLQIVRDGVVDTHSAYVTLLMLSSGVIYQQAMPLHQWWYWRDEPPGWVQVKR